MTMLLNSSLLLVFGIILLFLLYIFTIFTLIFLTLVTFYVVQYGFHFYSIIHKFGMFKNKVSHFTIAIALVLLLCHMSVCADLNSFSIETDSQAAYQEILEHKVGITSNGTDNSTAGNNTNITYCNNTNGTNCTLTQQQIIIILNNHGKRSFFFVIIDGQAIRCPPSCVRCTDGSTCNTCLLGFALDSSNRCVPCRGCHSCSVTNTSQCLSCFLPQILNDTTKLCDKPIECTSKGCQTCTSPNICTSCFEGYSLSNKSCTACSIIGCNKCDSNIDNCDSDGCGIGFVYFENTITSTKQCNQCTAGCASCETSNLDNCLGCLPGYFSKMDNKKKPAANTCTSCLKHCVKCLDSTTCIQCADGYMTSSDNLRCVSQCSSSCFTCQQNLPNNCLSCTFGYVYNAKKKTCTVDVKTCNSLSSCIACPQNYILSSGKCLLCNVSDSNCGSCLFSNLTACSSCNIGYYLSDKLSCKSCPSNCEVCLGEYTCTECSNSYYLKSQKGGSTGSCQQCESPCKTCHEKAGLCTSCIKGHTLKGSKCIGNVFVSFITKINIDMPLYNTISNSFNTYLLSVCSKVRPTKSGQVFIERLSQGSTDVSGGVSTDPSQAVDMQNAILSGFAPGTNIQGSPVISTTATTHDKTTQQQSSANLGLILGVSIPLLILLILVLIFIGVKLKGKNKYQQYGQPVKNQNNQSQGYMNRNQRNNIV